MRTKKAVEGTNDPQQQHRSKHVLRSEMDILDIINSDLWPKQQLIQADQPLQLHLCQAYITSTCHSDGPTSVNDVTVIVTKVVILCQLLVNRGHITKQVSLISVFIHRIKQNCFQLWHNTIYNDTNFYSAQGWQQIWGANRQQHLSQGLFPRITWVRWQQKGITILDSDEATNDGVLLV